MQPMPGLYVGPAAGASDDTRRDGFEAVGPITKRSGVRVYRATAFEALPEPAECCLHSRTILIGSDPQRRAGNSACSRHLRSAGSDQRTILEQAGRRVR
jgi:hypothetical protein